MFKEVADIKTSDQLHLPVPDAKFETVVVQPSDYQQDMVADLSERAAAVHSGMVDPSEDNMLKITGDGRKLGLDQRLINPLLPDDPESKLNACVQNVLRIWEEGKADRLTQLLFCDLSTPKNDGTFNVYDDIKAKLIAAGVPEKEIAFMEDKLLKYFPAEIERQTGYIRGFEADIQTVTTHPQIVEGFCGMEILGKHYMEKEDAGEMILAACKEMKATEPIPLGSYRGFQMELSFDSFRHDFDITLKGAVSHRVSLGTDARGNIIRLDNALSSIPEKLEKAHEQLTNLQNQQEATRAELGKPFPQEAELAEKSARLAELDAALNMEDSMPEREEAEQADKPSVLADLKAKSEHIPPYRASGGREEVL